VHKGGKGDVVPVHTIKMYGAAEVQSTDNLTSALTGGKWRQSHNPATLTPVKEHPVPTEYEAW
jgi:hypothetical protein